MKTTFFSPKKINVQCKQNDHPAIGIQHLLVPHEQVDEGCQITVLVGNAINFITHFYYTAMQTHIVVPVPILVRLIFLLIDKHISVKSNPVPHRKLQKS